MNESPKEDLCFAVAVPSPVFGTFSYLSKEPVARGSRVVVPFGGRKTVGVVIERQGATAKSDEKIINYKYIDQVIDQRPIFSEAMLTLGEWLSRYYVHPLGEVYRTMLPASVQKKSKIGYYLTAIARQEMEAGGELSKFLETIFAKKEQHPPKSFNALIGRLHKKNPQWSEWTAESLEKQGFVKHGKKKAQTARFQSDNVEIPQLDLRSILTKSLPLKAVQAEAFAQIVEKGVKADPATRKPFMMRGVTGSGKTEIYLQTIASVLSENEMKDGIPAQSLVMVPEISLTPQMTRIFSDRFENRVAVVHSGMTDDERWRELSRIRSGEALVLIGPRSAVFGPFANLKLIIVDEEHDPSYKQHSGLLYHGRDVAVLRAKIEGATVLLGSATPSLESYQNALDGKYILLEMPVRVSGLPLPKVNLIEAPPPQRFGSVIKKGQLGTDSDASPPVDPQIIEELKINLANKQQSIVLVNRRGFAYYLYSVKHNKAMPCPNCSISLTLHKRSTILRCHYCDYRIPTAQVVADNPDDTLLAVGYGSEKLEQALSQQLPEAKIVRLDSDTAAKKNVLPQTLGDFREGKIDILVGTQILSKGHDFPNVTLMVLLDVDQLLDLPDFRATERTFQLVVQSAGRAGRAELPGRVLIQCARTQDPTILFALEQNYVAFAERELQLRRASRYPPFSRMVNIEVTAGDSSRAEQFSQRIVRWLEGYAQQFPEMPKAVKVMGPAVPAIEVIRGRFRRTLIFSSARTDALLQITRAFQLAFAKTEGDIRVKIDVDPQSLI